MSSKLFIDGAIPATFIADAIAKHQKKTTIGAHNIFLGQVRVDEIGDKKVNAINFESYREMAEKKIGEIREYAIEQYHLKCLHIYHSLGKVNAGEICFFVFVSSQRRKNVYAATEDIVNKVKNEVPIFGREIFADNKFVWKKNLN